MTSWMHLPWWTHKTIASCNTLSTLVLIVIIWSTQVRSNSGCSPTPSSASSWRVWLWSLSFDCLAVNPFLNVNRIETEDAFCFLILFFFGISLLLRMRFKVVINYTSKGCIPNSSCNLFPALNTRIFLTIDQIGEATSTKSVITWLYGHRDSHYLKTKRTSDLIFDGICQFTCRCLFRFQFLLFFLHFF